MLAGTLAAAIALVWTLPLPAQVRDGAAPHAPAGTASISGVVLADSQPALPLRFASVVVTGERLDAARVVLTAANGQFSVDALPAGHYSVSASKAGFVTMNAGATRPGRVGRGLDLRAGEGRAVEIRLPKGAVISGTVTDASGAPLQNVAVLALRLAFNPGTGRRMVVPVGDRPARTDDLGAYRIFGLPAGEYLLRTEPPQQTSSRTPLQMVTADEVRAALAAVASHATQSRPGMPPPPPPLPPAPAERPQAMLAPVYYPGTTMLDEARPVVLAAAEERLGVDFALDYVRKASVSGMIALPDGMPPPTIRLRPGQDVDPSIGLGELTVTAGADGRFRFDGVPPGRYLAAAIAAGPPQTAGIGWAVVPVTVSGDDVDGLLLPLVASLSATGRIVVDGSGEPPPSGRTALALGPDLLRGFAAPALVEVRADGTFSVSGLTAGPQRWRGTLGVRTAVNGWWLTSITGPEGDLLEAPLVLTHGLDDLVVRLSRNASTVTGTVRMASGRSAGGLHVVLFPPERSRWFFGAFRIAHAVTTTDGRFTVRNLPPGDYLGAVSDDLEANEWYDPQVLGALAAAATRVVVTRDVTTIDLRWAAER